MKRRAFQMVVLLILGAIVNVAVAWGVANSIDATSNNQEEIMPASSIWYVARYKTSASLWIVAMINLHSSESIFISDSRVPTWSRIKQLPSYIEGDTMPMLHDFAFGWPLLSMWYAVDAERDWQTGAVVTRKTIGAIEEFGLPLRPLWPGLAINTIFYAAMLWVVFFAPGMVRRRIRRRRGLCPACAYPVGSSQVCTECGAAVNAKRVTK